MEEVHELLIDEQGGMVRGEPGGIKKVLERLDQVEAKIDELIAKLPGKVT